MSSTFTGRLADPTDLDGLRGALAALDPGGRLLPLGMGRLEIGPGVLEHLVACVGELVGGRAGGRVVLVVDATPIRRAGRDLKSQVQRMLEGGYWEVSRAVIGAHHGELHADEEALDEAEGAVRGAGCVVVVGSGTITDICKVATRRVGGTPLVVVQTAASVDGFSDDVSVVLRNGVKRTIPSRWPDVLLADMPTIVEAPPAMTAAGYGDAISLYTAPADWYLALLVGMDRSYHPAPVEMLLEGGPDITALASGVGDREPGAMEGLVRLLALRGIASGVSGSTAILSGAEHVISHMLDMHAGQRGAALGVHGAQVGVATILVAAAWEALLGDLDPSAVDVDACFPEPEAVEPVVRAAFAGLDPTGAVGGECWNDYARKLARWRSNRERFTALLEGWPRHRQELRRLVATPERLAEALTLAGAPARFGDLAPPVAPETARWALLNCHLMRDRFNIVDLLYALGWWDAAFVERLLERARGAGGGL